MKHIAVATDSNSGITQQQGKELGVAVLPMPFSIGDKTFFEEIDLSQGEFYQRLAADDDIATSQPSIASVTGLWDDLLERCDEVVYIPMSSGLSGSCATAIALADDYDGRVQVVNNQRISVTQRQSVLDALELAAAGKTAAEIREILERTKLDSSIYIMVDTLKYLKKGGRVTPAAAAIGTVLNLKPVLQIQGERLDAYAKTRGVKQSRRTMIDALKKDLETRFSAAAAEHKLWLQIAHTANEEAANDFAREVEAEFPGYPIYIDRLSLSVACHIGPGSLALACTVKLEY